METRNCVLSAKNSTKRFSSHIITRQLLSWKPQLICQVAKIWAYFSLLLTKLILLGTPGPCANCSSVEPQMSQLVLPSHARQICLLLVYFQGKLTLHWGLQSHLGKQVLVT
jgi:hypothetical protein